MQVAKVVLPSPGGPSKRMCPRGSPRLAAAVDGDLEPLVDLALADHLPHGLRREARDRPRFLLPPGEGSARGPSRTLLDSAIPDSGQAGGSPPWDRSAGRRRGACSCRSASRTARNGAKLAADRDHHAVWPCLGQRPVGAHAELAAEDHVEGGRPVAADLVAELQADESSAPCRSAACTPRPPSARCGR